MKDVIIYTDGACSGNPGKGGYGAVLIYKDKRKEICQGYRSTTNNRMEMLAVITALKMLKEPCNVKLYSDSKYVVDSILKGWAESWQKNKWTRNRKKPVLNVDLWKELLKLISIHNVEFIWVKGHAQNIENEKCDFLARTAIEGILLEDKY